MLAETYKGVRLRVRALKGTEWGYCEQRVNGFNFFKSLGRDEMSAMDQLRRDVDAAHDRPEAYPEYWKPCS